MSKDPQTPEVTQRKSRKHKDDEQSARKSSHKKRKREEEDTPSQHTQSRSSPSKKQKHAQVPTDSQASSRSKHKKTSQKESQKSTQSVSTPPRTPPPSPFALQTTSLYLPLSPISQSSPTNGLCAEHLSPLILTYVAALGGILLSYNNPRISDTPPATSTRLKEDVTAYGRSVNEYAFSFTWLTADFLVLRPTPGAQMEGYVNVQNESRLGVLCWNLFNASIERKRLPKDWRWDGPTSRPRKRAPRDVDDEGTGENEEAEQEEDEPEGGFLDGQGEAVLGRHVKFRIVDWELDQGARADASATTSSLVSFEGTMLSQEDEDKIKRGLMIQEADRLQAKRKERERRTKAAQSRQREIEEEE